MSVVRVQVSQEVGLALACPPVHRYQPLLHSTQRWRFAPGCGRRERERERVCYFGGVVVFKIFSLNRLGIYRWWRELYGREGM
jgi:hypothetical protein